MRIQVDYPDSARAVAISIERDDATVADLARELGLDSDTAVAVDGVVHFPDTPLADIALVDGSRVTSLIGGTTGRSSMGRTWLGVVSGPGAGSIRTLDAVGAVHVGRDPQAGLPVQNSSVSHTHACIERVEDDQFSVTDLESLNGTWVDGKSISKETRVRPGEPIRVGSSTLELRTIAPSDRPVGVTAEHANDRGRILFNRPPRVPVAASPKPIVLPDRPAERIAPKLAIASLVAPLIFAGVMVVLLGRWQYALFGLLSPVMALSTWISGRRRAKRERKGDIRTHREALATLRDDVAAAVRDERARRASFAPDLLEVRRRIEQPSTRLWERRLADADALHVRVGIGRVTFIADTEQQGDDVATDVQALMDENEDLDDIELLSSFADGPIGVTGLSNERCALARSLVMQLSAQHGPADVQLAILTTDERVDEWSWAHWLPHSRAAQEGSLILTGDASEAFATSIKDALHGDDRRTGPSLVPGWLIVVDDLALLHRRSSAVREVLGQTERNIFGLVLADTMDQLPASTASVATFVGPDGEIELSFTAKPGYRETGVADLIDVRTAGEMSRWLARFEDPELPLPNGDLPRIVRAADMYGPSLTPEKVEQRWMLSTRTDKLETAIGVGERGIIPIDMVGDGPHALIGGTTGAGKSELLRSFVLGLAVNHDPDDLVFVLVDYKGGSAFDACGNLPHVVGFVTDLDAHLAERALLSMEAELHHRESVLRSVAAKDIAAYRELHSPQGPLPRLVVVIDEFATLRAELPDFVASLIGIAQRGRSLGVHLVLATQRPTGAVDANIKANTNLRIALRMQDSQDSRDVIDSASAAELSRSTPGRAYIRTGQGELTVVQTGYVSGSTSTSAPSIRSTEIPIGSGESPTFPATETNDEATELEQIVETILATPRRGPQPRRPWLPELPDQVTLADLSAVVRDDAGAQAIPVALGDDPSHQRRLIRQWNPADGGLVVTGALGSGVSTTVGGVAVGLGAAPGARPVWVFPVDHAAGGLMGIDRYPHIAPVIAGSDLARQARLFAVLRDALETRRELASDVVDEMPLIVVAIDGAAAFVDANGLSGGTPIGDLWDRVLRDGPGVGIVTVIGASRRSEVPRAAWAAAAERLLLEQSDTNDYSEIGVRAADVPTFAPGRGLWGSDAMFCQVIAWQNIVDLDEVVVRQELPDISPLATVVEREALAGIDAEILPDLHVAVGVDEASRRVARLSVRAGEHAVVFGPGGSGRTSALALIAEQLRAQFPDLVMVGIAPAPVASLFASGVFDAHGTVEGLEHVLTLAQTDERRWLIVIDDAERVDVDSGPLVDLAKNAPPNVTMIASLRSSTARQMYGHWSRFLRGSGNGILLQPDNSADGELLGVRLPRHERLPDVPGRGYLVSGSEAHVVQLAR